MFKSKRLIHLALLLILMLSFSPGVNAGNDKDKCTKVYWVPNVFTVEERSAIAVTSALILEVGHNYVLVEATAAEIGRAHV